MYIENRKYRNSTELINRAFPIAYSNRGDKISTCEASVQLRPGKPGIREKFTISIMHAQDFKQKAKAKEGD